MKYLKFVLASLFTVLVLVPALAVTARQVVHAATFTTEREFVKADAGIHSITVGEDGYLYLVTEPMYDLYADEYLTQAHIIQVDPLDGTYMRVIELDANVYGGAPYQILVDDRGYIYMSFLWGMIYRIDPDGNIYTITTEITKVSDMIFDNEGNILVLEAASNSLRTIDLFDLTSSHITYVGDWSSDLAIDSTGQIYVTTFSDQTIYTVDTSGVKHLLYKFLDHVSLQDSTVCPNGRVFANTVEFQMGSGYSAPSAVFEISQTGEVLHTFTDRSTSFCDDFNNVYVAVKLPHSNGCAVSYYGVSAAYTENVILQVDSCGNLQWDTAFDSSGTMYASHAYTLITWDEKGYVAKLTCTNCGEPSFDFSISEPTATRNHSFVYTYGEEPNELTFTPHSRFNLVSWSWDFGDGTTSTLESPTHTYSAPGFHTVTLHAYDDAGGYHVISKNKAIFAQDFRHPFIFRFFNIKNGAHLYTIDYEEMRDVMELVNEWRFEGEKFQVVKFDDADLVPVYRFWHSLIGSHLYTISELEKGSVDRNDVWHYEGEKFYVYESQVAGTKPIYRFFNTQNGAHLYTDSADEANTINTTLPHFKYEGIKFYVK